MKPKVSAGGGMAAMRYSWAMARASGGWWRFYRRLSTKNACKTCALGMGGQKGGMVNEGGHFPEVCKKSMQAQAGDMQPGVPESFFETTPLALMGKMTSRQLENTGRLTFPVMAGPGEHHYRRVSWDEALTAAGQGLKDAGPGRSFLYGSGRSSNEAAFLSQLVMRAFSCPHIHNCSYYCHQASGVALKKVYGSGTASVVLDDMAQADFAIVIGANPASNHPRLITQLMQLRRRGGKVLVINPLRELGLVRFRIPSDWRSMLFGSTISDLYIQPRAGRDIALLKALLKGVIESGAVDHEFVTQATDGWKQLRADLDACDLDELVADCGVDRSQIDEAIKMLVGAKRGIFMWAMGLTHHAHGVDNILALSNLALARGWLGRPGAGLMPIRGHSNVQGVGSVGVTPAVKEEFAQRLEKLYGITVPRQPGKDTYASMVAAQRGEMKAALLHGGNLYGSNPDSAWAGPAINNIDTVIHISTKLNTGHVHGRGKTSIILPALVRDEEQQRTTQESMFNFVRISEGGPALVEGEMRSEVDIIASLAEKILPEEGFDWSKLRDHQALREAMAEVVDGYKAIGNIGVKAGDEFQIDGRTFHKPSFATSNGRANFHVTPVPPKPDEGALLLMTLRSEGQFNTVVYEDEDLYRGVACRDAVLMNEVEAERRGFKEGQRVMVSTEVGEMSAVVHFFDMAQGCIAMYYPESNILVPQTVDKRSKTPAFKSVLAQVMPVDKKPNALPIAVGQ